MLQINENAITSRREFVFQFDVFVSFVWLCQLKNVRANDFQLSNAVALETNEYFDGHNLVWMRISGEMWSGAQVRNKSTDHQAKPIRKYNEKETAHAD